VTRTAVLAALLALLLAAPALGAVEPRTSLPDIEDEVMCVECGTPLAVSDSPVANQERAFIRREIAQGKTKAQIKADLVDQYGQDVLSDPHRHGFGKALWIVPVALVLGGAAVIFLALRRWRRNGPAPEAAPAPELSPEDARRLEADLSR
jgi:cytochrome c-type biogenesis protein CcmH/NrfF